MGQLWFTIGPLEREEASVEGPRQNIQSYRDQFATAVIAPINEEHEPDEGKPVITHFGYGGTADSKTGLPFVATVMYKTVSESGIVGKIRNQVRDAFPNRAITVSQYSSILGKFVDHTL